LDVPGPIEATIDRLKSNIKNIQEVQNVDANQALSTKQQSMIPIAAFTANGDLEKLKTALRDGLDAGLTVNEIKEILVHLYAYTGFPRSLNGIHTFMAVLDERQT
jgi:4-carboxymuconolactone decarboxylase